MDYKYYKIPNSLCAWGIVSFLFIEVMLQEQGFLYTAFLGFIMPFIILYPVYLIGGIGAGDIKLLCVIGVLSGHNSSIRLTVVSFFIAGILGLIKLVVKFYLNLIDKKNVYKVKTKIHYSYAIYITIILNPLIKIINPK